MNFQMKYLSKLMNKKKVLYLSFLKKMQVSNISSKKFLNFDKKSVLKFKLIFNRLLLLDC